MASAVSLLLSSALLGTTNAQNFFGIDRDASGFQYIQPYVVAIFTLYPHQKMTCHKVEHNDPQRVCVLRACLSFAYVAKPLKFLDCL